MYMLAYNTKSRAGLLKNVSAKPNEKSAPLAAAARYTLASQSMQALRSRLIMKFTDAALEYTPPLNCYGSSLMVKKLVTAASDR